MIEHLSELRAAGVSSFKIEGRMKSAYYAAVVTNAYRHAMDAAEKGEPLPPVWRDEVNKVSHREYSTGFFFDINGPGQYYNDAMYFSDASVAAVVESCDESGNAVLTQRNKFSVGDTLELMSPDNEPVLFTAAAITNSEGLEIESAPHPMMELRMKLPIQAPQYSIVRKMKQQAN
jgi:putative protease